MFIIAMSTTILGFIIAMLIKTSKGQQEDEKEPEEKSKIIDEDDLVILDEAEPSDKAIVFD